MSLPPSPVTQDTLDSQRPTAPRKSKRWRGILILLILGVIAAIIWQLLSLQQNSKPAGRPLAYAKTHLHTVAISSRPGVVYLGTHYGLFTSEDGGHTWPQSQGALAANMITSIAISPTNPDLLAVLAIPTEVGQQAGVYVSADAGKSWHFTLPANLPSSAYPYSVQSAPGAQGHFYLFLTYGGLFETQDLGQHWQAITDESMANLQTPLLLVDPANPDHLLMGGTLGLFETNDDGQSWQRVSAVQGSVLALYASMPRQGEARRIFCSTDHSLYSWQEGKDTITQVGKLPASSPPTRLLESADGTLLYALFGSDLWLTTDQGESWSHLWHFSRGDLVSLVLDPNNSRELLAGFFSPAVVLQSSDGGRAWQILTN